MRHHALPSVVLHGVLVQRKSPFNNWQIRIPFFILLIFALLALLNLPLVGRILKLEISLLVRIGKLLEFVDPPLGVAPFLADLCELENANLLLMIQIEMLFMVV